MNLFGHIDLNYKNRNMHKQCFAIRRLLTARSLLVNDYIPDSDYDINFYFPANGVHIKYAHVVHINVAHEVHTKLLI